jgi:hypothetical protein
LGSASVAGAHSHISEITKFKLALVQNPSMKPASRSGVINDSKGIGEVSCGTKKREETKMSYEEIEKTREDIESWVKLLGKKRVEERLNISIFGLEEEEHHSIVYE